MQVGECLGVEFDLPRVGNGSDGRTAPRGDLRGVAFGPFADSLLGNAGCIRHYDLVPEGLDDSVDYMHEAELYRLSVHAASPYVPNLVGAPFDAVRHNRSMPETRFDPDLVRRTLKERGISVEKFSQAVGLPHRSAANKIFKGERRVQIDEATRIYQYLGLIPIEHDSVRVVPVIGLTAAGHWREAVEMPVGKMMVPSSVAGPRSFAVEVKGDSMDLLIEDGGWVVVDPDDKELRPGKSYLLQNGEHEVTVKRYQKLPARFEPVSSNDEHTGFLASDCDPIILGRVVWKGSRV